MWPILLDMTKEESMQHLRCLEIDAFSGLVNALRAQGTLNKEKLHLLRETSNMLHISQERHKAEIRRVVNDERLNTISYHVNGERHCGQEWADEGQRVIPLMPRVAPQTAYSVYADEVADATNKLNKQLPVPASTERKRVPVASSPTHPAAASTSSSAPAQAMYRNAEGDRKRKLASSMENCVLAQHLMAPPKISKIQQIYRQRSKSRLKEQLGKLKPPEVATQHAQQQQPPAASSPSSHQLKPATPTPIITHTPKTSTPKINILQNITTSLPCRSFTAPSIEEKRRDEAKHKAHKTPTSAECDSTARVSPTTPKASSVSAAAAATPCSVPSNASKMITTTDGQKLILVSTHANHQLAPTPSILQRTLTTVPFKSLAVSPKFRVVPKTAQPAPPVPNVNLPPTMKATGTAKQKLVTMRSASAASKKVIPLSGVQVLNTKAGIKVLPIGASKVMQRQSAAHAKHLKEAKARNHDEHRVVARMEVHESDVKVYDDCMADYTRVESEIVEFTSDGCITIGDGTDSSDDANAPGEAGSKVNGSREECVLQLASTTNDCTIVNDTESPEGAHGENAESDAGVTSQCGERGHSHAAHSTSGDNANNLNHTEAVCARLEAFGEDVESMQCLLQEEVVHNHMDEPIEEGFEEKVDLDSSVFIYGESLTNHVSADEVLVDGADRSPTEVLNAVHALDESFANAKNVRS